LSERYDTSLVIWERAKLERISESFDLIAAIMAVGIVVRSLCGIMKNKWTDTPVVAIDSSLSCAVPVIGGHHGANELALNLAEAVGLFPAITTATDAAKRPCIEDVASIFHADVVNKDASKEINLSFLREDVPVLRLKGPKIVIVDENVAVLKRKALVVGLGARKGVNSDEVLQAIESALMEAGKSQKEIGVLATTELKRGENGIIEAAKILNIKVLYLSHEVLNAQSPPTPSRAKGIGLAGVAEPAVLALAEKLIMPKRIYGRVTVALGE
jgi:cobalt-precorrin 5A hydrolase